MNRAILLCIYAAILIIASIIVFFILRWRKDRPLIHHFTASTIWKAFVLNSISASLVILIALTTKNVFDNYELENNDDNKKQIAKSSTNIMSIIITLIATFVASMVAYTSMYVLFGFGGGMIAN